MLDHDSNILGVISRRLIFRRLLTVFALLFSLIFSGLLVTSRYFNSPVKASTSFNQDDLVLGSSDMLYVGMGGYMSQRPWSKFAEPVDASHQHPISANLPADNIFNNTHVNSWGSGNICPTKWNESTGRIEQTDTTYTNCFGIVGNGSGMIIHFNKSITIAGTLFIADRVVLDAPEITIASSGRVIAAGQDAQMGRMLVDDEHKSFINGCGSGGIGGKNGGSSGDILSSISIINIDIPAEDNKSSNSADCTSYGDTKGKNFWLPGGNAPGDYQLGSLNPTVAVYFKSTSGGSGGDSSNSVDQTILGRDGGSAGVGVGGAGPSGATGKTADHFFASSGGGGGGFGLVFHATKKLEVDSGALIKASGGNVITANGSPIDNLSAGTTGGFGGPGGGGVIVVDTDNLVFIDGLGYNTQKNLSVFDVSAGKFATLVISTLLHLAPLTTISPGQAGSGKLLVTSISSPALVTKSVTKSNINEGDTLSILISVPAGLGTYTIDDEILNDGEGTYFQKPADFASTLSISPAGNGAVCTFSDAGHQNLVHCVNIPAGATISYNLVAPPTATDKSGRPVLYGGKAMLTQEDNQYFSTEGFDRNDQTGISTSRTKVLVSASDAKFPANYTLATCLLSLDCLISNENYSTTTPNYYSLDDGAHKNTKIYSGELRINDVNVDSESVIMYAGKQLIGDVYSNSSNAFKDFTSYGEHLGLNNDKLNATWKLQGYQIDPESLLYWDNSNYVKNLEMQRNIGRLKNMAKPIATLTPRIYNFSGFALSLATQAGIEQNPEGQVWLADGPTTISGATAFSGRGTIIINGNLTISGNINSTNSQLGLIVLGNVTTTGTNPLTMRSIIFSNGQVNLARPLKYTGSIVANDIKFGTSAIVKYDQALVETPPPGINYFANPAISEGF